MNDSNKAMQDSREQLSSNVEENNAMMGMLLYDLKNQCIKAESTLVVIHHANRSKNVGVQSVSGHGSITGACNSIVTMHYLQDENNKDIKHIKYKKFCISINPIFPLSVLKIT